MTVSNTQSTAIAKLLIVDDEVAIQNVLSHYLTASGYVCGRATCAAEVWTYLEQNTVELVTLDIGLPSSSGLELLEQLQMRSPDTAVLMVTGLADTCNAVHALTHGACGYVNKPVSKEELLAQVARGLERRRLIIDNRQYVYHLKELIREQTVTIRSAHEETIHLLVEASLYRDEETGAHIRRTGLYSELLAASAGWDSERVDQIRLAAPMHDVGKIGIPDHILRKPGKLSPAEYRIMKTHTVVGARMLSGSAWPVLRMAEAIAMSHHERWDGHGYPAGLAEDDIPESGRIVAIVDVYDALSHDRVYRPAMSEAEVLKIMVAGRGTHFDPRLLDTFLGLLPEMRAISQSIPDAEMEEQSCAVLVEPTFVVPSALQPLEGNAPFVEWGVPTGVV